LQPNLKYNILVSITKHHGQNKSVLTINNEKTLILISFHKFTIYIKVLSSIRTNKILK